MSFSFHLIYVSDDDDDDNVEVDDKMKLPWLRSDFAAALLQCIRHLKELELLSISVVEGGPQLKSK